MENGWLEYEDFLLGWPILGPMFVLGRVKQTPSYDFPNLQLGWFLGQLYVDFWGVTVFASDFQDKITLETSRADIGTRNVIDSIVG